MQAFVRLRPVASFFIRCIQQLREPFQGESLLFAIFFFNKKQAIPKGDFNFFIVFTRT